MSYYLKKIYIEKSKISETLNLLF